MANTKKEKKRKRTTNTSKEQYELYLSLMENDYTFQSGIINPSIEDNYIEGKWDELCSHLNAIGDGPQLCKEEWKKRFKDWKNATRSKYRKMKEGLAATGGGEEIRIKLTDLEERGFNVWGKVAVTGAISVTVLGGLQLPQSVEIETIIVSEQLPKTNDQVETEILLNLNSANTVISESNTAIAEPVKKKLTTRKRPRKEFQPFKPINDIANELQKLYMEFNKD